MRGAYGPSDEGRERLRLLSGHLRIPPLPPLGRRGAAVPGDRRVGGFRRVEVGGGEGAVEVPVPPPLLPLVPRPGLERPLAGAAFLHPSRRLFLVRPARRPALVGGLAPGLLDA